MSDNSFSVGPDAVAAISKSDAGQEATPSSLESTPERDTEIVQDQAQPQKRKGGRKPIYATSEERKQRNRQAQAAFRERRTEYIKQLETTIKHHEETLQSLQQSHRSAADECLMLRYKNSLLERILLEKGIDVQAELQLKTGSPALGPSYMPHAAPAPVMSAGLQRTAMNRQHARRSGQTFPQRMGPGSAPQSEMSFSARSPQGHPTPSSHASSPTAMSTQSPASMQQGGMTPPAPVVSGQQQYAPHRPSGSRYVMQHPPHRPPPSTQYANSNGASSMSTGGLTDTNPGALGGPSAYYPSPFQKHIDQLGKYSQQEYDAQPSSMLEPEPETSDQSVPQSTESGQYSHPRYHNQLPPPGMHQRPAHQPQSKPAISDHEREQQVDAAGQIPGMNQLFDPYDPMLDADPFGLSASMHFPTNYSFEQPPAQR
ncbi:hypothetical protein MBLNU459_g3622t1 [Dothideomycetes sp. NU459]